VKYSKEFSRSIKPGPLFWKSPIYHCKSVTPQTVALPAGSVDAVPVTSATVPAVGTVCVTMAAVVPVSATVVSLGNVVVSPADSYTSQNDIFSTLTTM